jgi:hypothetical protein
MKPLLIIAGFLCVYRLDAAPQKFPEHNFVIEVPESWTDITPKPPLVVVAIQSADQRRRLLVFGVAVPEKERAKFATDFRAGIKSSLEEQRCQIDPEQQITIGDLPFITFTAHRSDGIAFTSYVTAAGDRGYLMQTLAEESLARSDAELRGIVHSFRLLSPAKPLPLHTPLPSKAYKVGRIVGIIWTITLIPSVLGVTGWLIYRARKKASARAVAAESRDAAL